MFFKKQRRIIYIEGMNCEQCVKKIEEALENLVDISKAKVNLKKKCAIVTYENSADDILLTQAIEKLGYTVTGIKELS